MSEFKPCHLGRPAKRFMRSIRGLSAVTGVVISSVLIAAPAVAESSVHEQANAPAAVASTSPGYSTNAHPADAANVAIPNPGKRGVAVIYQDTKDLKYYRVHNALLLDVRNVGIEIAHVNHWNAGQAPHLEKFWVCYAGKICPKTPKPPESAKNWVLVEYHRYWTQPCPKSGGATYCPDWIIAFKNTPNRVHNGAFACWQPTGGKSCVEKWPGEIRKQSGTLGYVHYVNPTPPVLPPGTRNPRSYAKNPEDFKFVAEPAKGTVSAVRTCTLLTPHRCE
ncbi:hypothetical protein ACWC9T_36635 [Kitasatospora sp. NPDC001159]